MTRARHIKFFEEFHKLIQESDETAVNNLTSLMQGLVKTITRWFTTGRFSKEGISLLYIEPSTMTDILEKNIIFSFTDQEWYYQAILIVPLVVGSEEIKKANLLVKKYSMVESNPEDSIQGPLVNQIPKPIDDIQSEFVGTKDSEESEDGAPGEQMIMDLIAQMADEPKSPGTTGYEYQEPPAQ